MSTLSEEELTKYNEWVVKNKPVKVEAQYLENAGSYGFEHKPNDVLTGLLKKDDGGNWNFLISGEEKAESIFSQFLKHVELVQGGGRRKAKRSRRRRRSSQKTKRSRY